MIDCSFMLYYEHIVKHKQDQTAYEKPRQPTKQLFFVSCTYDRLQHICKIRQRQIHTIFFYLTFTHDIESL